LSSSLFLRVKKRGLQSSKEDVSIFSHDDLLASSDRLSIVCYTDGSASPNPGPAGSGASIFLPMSNTVVDLGASLGHNSNNFAELYAIGTCLSTLVNTVDELPSRPTRVLLFTDSLYASRAVTSTKPPATHKDTIAALRRLLAKALALFPVSLVWVRGHCGAGGNERVDRIAKRFAKCSIGNPPLLRPTSFPSVSTTSHWPFPLAAHSSTPLHVFLSNLPSPPASSIGSVDPFHSSPPTVQLSDDSGLDFKHSE
jgi:ribonuclease HI